MKIWFNKINESRRSIFEVEDKDENGLPLDVEVTIGRDVDNMLVLESPLVSRFHAVVRRKNNIFELENIGLNVCMIGDTEIGVGELAQFDTGMPVRIWPYTLSFELETRDVLALTKRMQKLWISRNAARPTEEPRIAMPFVDPDGMPAKDLLQTVGLAGLQEGQVSIDGQHPQFMIASSGATSEQCLKLIERVREQVLLQTGIDLQLNLQIW